jgi:aminoglycoside phosphotransferase (APT) family kinase protein
MRQPIGPKLAEGRDAEIFEHGPGRVLRLARDGRPLAHEAEVMRHVRTCGYPVPEVHDAGDGFMVMERVEGPTMLDAVVRAPQRLGDHGRLLADLHRRLHAIPAPPWLAPARLAGDRLLHGDLHPLNVLMAPDGPVVIDWTNARRGAPALDVADAWLVLATADVPGSLATRTVARFGTRVFLRSFLAGVDREEARRALPVAAARRLGDANTTDGERARMRRLVPEAPPGGGRSPAGGGPPEL